MCPSAHAKPTYEDVIVVVADVEYGGRLTFDVPDHLSYDEICATLDDDE